VAPRWRFRATLAVLTAATFVVAGYLIIQYRDSGDGKAVFAAADAPATTPAPAASGPRPSKTSPSVPSSPTPSKKPSSKSGKPATGKGGFPGSHNTGVPDGVNLAAYSGPCTITKNNTAVTGKLVNCDPFLIQAKNVTISKSKINGTLTTTEASAFSFTLEDSEVNAGMWQGPAVLSTNMTIRRSNIHGGATAVTCAANCDIRDSWLHGQLIPSDVDWHLGGFLANDTDGSGRSNVTLVHNTIVCDARTNPVGGGCSGNVNLFPDFGPVSGVVIRNNYFGASVDISYCVYGGTSKGKAYESGVRDIVFEDNVFQRGKNRKCGGYGPVTSFNTGLPGNRWRNNVWEDGATVPPAN
jgi:hypothetical protein